MNLIETFLAQAAARPDQTAIIDGNGRKATYADIASGSETLAGAWRKQGLKPGNRVLLAMGLSIELYVALAALWRIGAVVVLPEPALGLSGLRHAAHITRPRAYLSSGWYRALGMALPELRQVPLSLTPFDNGIEDAGIEQVGPDHPALISFTSGSTGLPKAIVRSHAFLAAQNDRVADLLRPAREGEIDLVAFPVFVIANLALGVTSVLPNWNLKRHDAANPKALGRHIRRHGVTRVLVPPAICEIIASTPQIPQLQAIFTGGGPVFPDLMERLARQQADAEIVAVYGSTEAEPISHLHVRDMVEGDWQTMKAGAGLLAGKPIPEIALRLVDDEILVTGAHVNQGYLDPSQDATNKVHDSGVIWHRTGDAGRLDDQGRLWLLGRHDGRVGTLFPFAVEVAARSWPGVHRAGLVAIDQRPVLAIKGDKAQLATWQRNASAIADIKIVAVKEIPLDRRHRSKIDYMALRHMLRDELTHS
jgi:olefin beta-lactone synthetase